MKKNYTLCPGADANFKCPLRWECARYLPNLDKKTTDYFEIIPYSKEKGKCNFFEKDDPLHIEDIIVN